ncbi:putative ribonuclease H-like domain-containing protein [Tanacetum coccineum]
MHIKFLENKSNVVGSGPEWLFDIDSLTKSMNYELVTVGNQTNGDAGIETNVNAGQAGQEKIFDHEYILLPLMYSNSPISSSTQSSDDKDTNEVPGKGDDDVNKESGIYDQERTDSSTQDVNTVGPSINTANANISTGSLNINTTSPIPNDPSMPSLEETGIFDGTYNDEDVGTEADLNNLETTMNMDVKSAFLYGTIKEEVYVCQPRGFEDPQFLDKVYKVEKALYGLHQALRAWYETLSTYLLEKGFRRGTIDKALFIKKDKGDILLVQVYVDDIIFGSSKKSLCVEFEQMMHKRFQMSSIGELTFFLGLQVKQKDDGIFISQDKYVADILKKFDFVTVKTVSTLIETNKALLKDEEAEDVDVHLYRSMIGSLMYLTASRPDIMFAVCACARFQVTPKVSHLHAVKRIFRYLKGQPKLGLWYPRDSPFDLEAFSHSDYAGASLDRKSIIGGVVDPKLNACYGFNFMNTKIYIDNESTICIVKNPVFHSKTKHIEIRHHFIRDFYEKKLIQVIKIYTDQNVADLLTKAFDVGRFQYLIATANDEIQVSTVGLPYYWYALTTNPTIYVSLIEKLWQTATVKTVDNGEQEITATVDGKEFTVTEAYVRRHLQLADVEAAEGEGSGHPSEPQPPPSTTQPTNKEPIPTVVSSSHQKTQTPRKALKEVTKLPQISEPIPNVPDEAVYEEWDDKVGKATTTAASLDAAQASGNITKTKPTAIPNVPLSQEIGTCGSPRCQEAMGGFIAQTRSEKKVESLEADLQQTKKVYGTAYTKLIKKVKKLEKTVKSNQARRRAKFMVSDNEEDSEDSSKQRRKIDEIDQDPDITLVQHDAEIQGRHRQEIEFETKVYTIEDVSTAGAAVTTAGASISTASPPRDSTTEDISTAETLMYIRRSAAKDKGKAKMDESELEQTKTKLQQRQERAGYEAAVRLQEQLDEEERKRIVRVHEEASSFNIEEWEDIQATIKADEELAQRIQSEEREKYSEGEKTRLLAELIN